MTKKQYLKFVSSSEIFKNMSRECQKIVTEAEGDQRDEYIGVLKSADQGLATVKKEFVNSVQKEVEGMKRDVHKAKKVFLEKAEHASQTQDEIAAEKLLTNI